MKEMLKHLYQCQFMMESLLSKYEYVMWLDADGSMPPETVGKLLEKSATDRETVFIGSRFSNGGGYKGVEKENQNLVQVVKNVYSSEDSVLAGISFKDI